jgi:predicted extracellular nuclease
VVISQIYGGGGNSGATYKKDFIELLNAGNTTVNLTGWSVQYASATATGWSSTKTNLSGALAPGHYYLIQESGGAGGTTDLPTPDVTGTIDLSATAGKVALVNSTTALSGSGCPFGATIVDFVGYGTTADCFEGSGRAPAPSNTTAAVRAAGGCTDTNVNSSDFATAGPSARNSSSPTNQCPGTLTPPEISLSFGVGWREVSLTLYRMLTSASFGLLLIQRPS